MQENTDLFRYVAHFVFQDPQTGAMKLPDCVWAGLSRALIGFVYVAIFQIGTLYVSDQYLFEPAFQKKNLIKKCLLIGLWGRINLYKYVSCWLITEGVSDQQGYISHVTSCTSIFDCIRNTHKSHFTDNFRYALLSV